MQPIIKDWGTLGLELVPWDSNPHGTCGWGTEVGMELRLPVELGVVGPLTLSLEAPVFRQLPWHRARITLKLPWRVKPHPFLIADAHLQVFGRMGRSTRSPWQMPVSQSHAPFLSDTKSVFFTINTCQLIITSFRFQLIPIMRFKFHILITPPGHTGR